jgi:hemerythrin-like domain-containing protein
MAATAAAKVQRAARQAGSAVGDAVAPVAKRARTTAAAARDSAAAVGASIGKTTRSTGRAVRARGSDLASGARSVATSRGAKIAGIAAAGVAVGLVANLGRRAMVQAPTALAGDWLEGLKAEHRATLAVFDKLEKTSANARAKRTALFADLKAALSKHAFTEENVIYPALRQHGGKDAADRFTHDHGYVKQYLFELGEIPSDNPAFLEKLRALRADLEKHIREEEDSVLPPLHATLGEEANARITALANKEGFKLA